VLKPLNPKAAKQYMQVSVRGRNATQFCLLRRPAICRRVLFAMTAAALCRRRR
jgi:hypothetical protein